MEKIIRIKSIEDILKIITEENKDNFLKDFSNFLTMNINTKKLGLSEVIINPTEFMWIDDGKNDIRVNIEFKQKDE
jgi:meiotically up-regulated gene 157 (Mug157) protein